MDLCFVETMQVEAGTKKKIEGQPSSFFLCSFIFLFFLKILIRGLESKNSCNARVRSLIWLLIQDSDIRLSKMPFIEDIMCYVVNTFHIFNRACIIFLVTQAASSYRFIKWL